LTLKPFLELIKKRRSIYALAKQLPISDKQLTDLVGELIKHTPSALNSQSSRVVILLNEQHDKLWDIAYHSLEAIVPPEHFAPTKQKLEAFKGGYGTILFFEDQATINGLEKAYPTYKHNFLLGHYSLLEWYNLPSGVH
jgi:predicted oxidoreductase (fatty acid repression mutant protein)